MKNLLIALGIILSYNSYSQIETIAYDSSWHKMSFKVEYDTVRAMGLQFVSYGDNKKDFGYNIDKLLIVSRTNGFSAFNSFYKVLRFRQKTIEVEGVFVFEIMSNEWIWEETSLDEYDQIITERKNVNKEFTIKE